MKKLLLTFVLFFFVTTLHNVAFGAGQINSVSDEISCYFDDDPKKADVAKEDKGTSATKCASSASCDKSKCAGKTGSVASSCCASSKSSVVNPGKAGCCSKEKIINDSDKK